MWYFLGWLLTILLFLTSIFLILLVLVQRGKGGGLVGALGGMGGQSAFGAKAGGIFWATSVAAGVWILLCIATVTYNGADNRVFAGASGANAGQLQDAPNAVEKPDDATNSGTGAANSGAPASNGATAPTNSESKTQGEVTEKDFADEAAPADAKKE